MKYLYLFALAVISLIIALFPKADAITFVFNIGDTYYVFSLRTLCIDLICIYLIAGILCATQTYFKANNLIAKIHFFLGLFLPLLLLVYKTVVWYKEANKSYLFDNPVVNFDFEYGNVLVFVVALTFCIFQITALINIVLSSINKSHSTRL